MRYHMGYRWIALALAEAVLSKRYFELFSYSLQKLIKYHMKQSLNPSKAFWISPQPTGKKKKKSWELFNIDWHPLRLSTSLDMVLHCCRKVALKPWVAVPSVYSCSGYKLCLWVSQLDQAKFLFVVFRIFQNSYPFSLSRKYPFAYWRQSYLLYWHILS